MSAPPRKNADPCSTGPVNKEATNVIITVTADVLAPSIGVAMNAMLGTFLSVIPQLLFIFIRGWIPWIP